MADSIAPDAPYLGDDIYCDEIIPGRRPVRMVVETERVLAFHHTRPFWPVHIVVIPKEHIPSFLSLDESYQAVVWELIRVVQQVARQVIGEHGAAAILTNLGAYQDSKHLHWHVYFGRPLR